MNFVILVGDVSVGKSCLITAFTEGHIRESIKSTVCIEFRIADIPIATGGLVRTQIWDTAGQECYQSVIANHYRGAHGVILAYSIENLESYLNISKWLERAMKHCNENVVYVLVGTKLDLVINDPGRRQVPESDAKEFAEKHGMLFYETSAFERINVAETFEVLAQIIFDKFRSGEFEDNDNFLQLESEPAGSKFSCCGK